MQIRNSGSVDRARIVKLLMFALLVAPAAANAQLTATAQDGDLMVNDATLNVTWADVASPSDLIWSSSQAGSAQAWVASLNTMVNSNGTIGYGGYTNWTLPTGDGTYTTQYNTNFNFGTPEGLGPSTSGALNQLGYLFINELGNTPGSTITNTGPFTKLGDNAFYWSGTAEGMSTGGGWGFNTADGFEYGSISPLNDYVNAEYGDALAVRAGLASPVPLPASAWLMLSGMGVLGVVARRRRSSVNRQDINRKHAIQVPATVPS
jgi:hypothetical protein